MINQEQVQVGDRTITGDMFIRGNSDAAVLLLHGFLASKESNYIVAEALNASNIDAFAIDFNGHGMSEGNFSEFTVSKAVQDCRAGIAFLKERGYGKIGLFGYSIGGFIALNALKKNRVPIKSVVLGSPLSNFQQVFKHVDLNSWRRTNLLRASNLALNIKLDYAFYEDGCSYDGYDSYSSINKPTLIIHGTEDDVVPISQSEALVKSLPNAYLLKLNGALHNIFAPSFKDDCLDSTVKWFSSHF